MLKQFRYASASVLLALWAFIMSYVCAVLMIGHWVPLPVPKVGAPHFVSSSSMEGSQGWKALHFLSSECPCSQRILNHLMKRKPLQDIEEIIVYVGESNEDFELITDSRYTLDRVTQEELKSKYNVESVPLLVLLDSTSTIRYSGAYTTRKQGFAIQDVRIISQTLAGETIPPLPLFGCGLSKEWTSITNPLGLK